MSWPARILLPSSTLAAIFLVVGAGFAVPQTSSANSPDSRDLVQFLTQTINWYRQLTPGGQIANEPSDVMVVNDNRQIADQVVKQAFEFARTEADALAKQASSEQVQSQNPDSAHYQALLQLSAKLDNQIRDTEAELERLRQKLDTASGHSRKSLQSAIAEVQSELDLANARRDALRSMVEFVSGASTSGLGATGLRAQIEAMARVLPPEVTQKTAGKEPNNSSRSLSPASVTGNSRPSPAGIWGLTAELFELSGKIHLIDQTIGLTDELSKTARQMRSPLVTKLKELSQQGDQLAAQPDSNDPTVLARRRSNSTR